MQKGPCLVNHPRSMTADHSKMSLKKETIS
uniref:Uncharacterized protein n=1 Tax=Anguilla anguilla TaxID=7936 RepID=A0A0E9U194_ANGAN